MGDGYFEKLHTKIRHLEEDNERLRQLYEAAKETNIDLMNEQIELRQRMEELERIVKQDADQLIMRDRIIRERGERMKTIWDAIRLYYPESKDMSPWKDWFDQETGEPL